MDVWSIISISLGAIANGVTLLKLIEAYRDLCLARDRHLGVYSQRTARHAVRISWIRFLSTVALIAALCLGAARTPDKNDMIYRERDAMIVFVTGLSAVGSILDLRHRRIIYDGMMEDARKAAKSRPNHSSTTEPK